MITGYNTDVHHRDRDFHVQTEDKGTSNPFIESLIYVGGQVLAAKRTGYAEVLEQGNGHKAIMELMDQQHRAMIAAIRTGRFDEKVVALFGGELPSANQNVAVAAVAAAAPAPAKVASAERSLDEVILEYLTSEAQHEQLVLMLDEEVELTFGQKTSLTVRASSSKSGLPISGARVVFKMISTVTEARILSTGSTDVQGCLQVDLQIPVGVQGNAALIITASSAIGTAELKYLL